VALPLLPRGLAEVDIPTVIFQGDPYTYTHRRVLWSLLFDHVAVFHAGLEKNFSAAGNPHVFLMLHAVDAEVFDGPHLDREYEVSAVGRSDGTNYSSRRRILSRLSEKFRMNAWQERFTYEETAKLYRTSKIVVNVPRDDFPGDVSLRFAEAMAAGALFVTRAPSELASMGFEDGVHFLGYRYDEEVVELVRHYLEDETARLRIAAAGHEKVLQEHTYDVRVEQLLARLAETGDARLAPARGWPQRRVDAIYLDFFAGHRRFREATKIWPRVARRSVGGAVRGAALIAGAWSRRWR